MSEKRKLNNSGFISIAVAILAAAVIGLVLLYVVNRNTFTEGITATETYTGNAKFDPTVGIIVGDINEDGTVTNTDIEEIYEQIDGAGTYLRDDEEFTKEEKLQYLLNAELVTKFPYISSLEGDESKLNGVIKLYRYTNQIEAVEGEQERTEENTNIIFDASKTFFIGDSWTVGLKNYIKDNVNGEYKENHFLCQEGQSATSTIFINNNIQTKIDAVGSEISNIVIMLGLNGTNESQSNRMNQIIEFLSTTYSSKTIYVLKVPHVSEAYSYSETYGADDLNSDIDAYNPIIRDKCSALSNVKFIDTTNNLMNEELYLDSQYATDDGLHLNDNGMAKWYSNIKECIGEGKSTAEVSRFLMQYVAEEEFDKMCDAYESSGNEEVFKYFTINEDNQIVTAYGRRTHRVIETNNPQDTLAVINESAGNSPYQLTGTEKTTDRGTINTYSSTTYTINKDPWNYKALVSKYTMPFNLLWAFLVQTKDWSLVKELADLAYESEIVIAIYDNESRSVNISTQTYNKHLQYTQSTRLAFPAVGQTTPSININSSSYNNVIRGCIGSIESGEAKHNYIKYRDRGESVDTRGCTYAQLYQYYVSNMDENGVITEITGTPFEFIKKTTITSVGRDVSTIGVVLADTWIGKFEASYLCEQKTTGPNGRTAEPMNDEYVTIDASQISSALLSSSGIIGGHLTSHSEKLKKAAIDEIVRNTDIPLPNVLIDTTIIRIHIESCYDCRKKIEEAYKQSWTTLIRNGMDFIEQICLNIINHKDYSGDLDARIKYRKVYEHTEQSESEKSQASQLQQFKSQLQQNVTYTQSPVARTANLNIIVSTNFTKNTSTYEKDTTTRENEGEKFKEIITKPEYYESKTAILSRTEWFWEYIRANEDTASLEDIIRYLFNIAFDTDEFGTFSLDTLFSIFEPKQRMLSTGSSSKLAKEYIRSWENGAMRKFVNDEGEYTDYVAGFISPDKEVYYLRDDGYGHPTVGFGIDIYNSGFLDRFLEAGYTTEQLSNTSGVVQIPVEFVDALEEEMFTKNCNTIREKAKNAGVELENYQLYALVSRAYNCGMGGALRENSSLSFWDAFKTLYNQELDDMYGEMDGNFEHPMYVQFMDTPNMSAGKISQGLINRRKSEWTLFQTGYMTTLEKWMPKGGDIIECCEIVMNELLDNNVQYSLSNLAWYDIERSVDFTSGIGCCCATYVAAVIYKADLMSEDYLNSYNYNVAGVWSDLCRDAGWTLVSEEEAEPGDICVWNEHVFIYAGGNEVWDQATGCISSDGDPPAGKPLSLWSTYKQNNLDVWRRPYTVDDNDYKLENNGNPGEFEEIKGDKEKYGIYTSSSGRTYIEWNQNGNNRFSNLPFYNGETMGGPYGTGCAVYSVAMLLNSIGMNVDPAQVHQQFYYNGGTDKAIDNCISAYGKGINAKGVKVVGIKQDKLIEVLKSGRGVMVHVKNGYNNLYTDYYHWLVVADIRKTKLGSTEGYDVFVVTSTDRGRGWQKLETITKNYSASTQYYIDQN